VQLRHRVLLLGLDNAGKTSLCQQLAGTRHGWPSRHPRPQHHVLHQEIRLASHELDLVDPCGDWHRCLDLWEELVRSGPEGIIFVVDAADQQRLGDAHAALHWVLRHPDVHGLPILLLGNKVDLPTALGTWDLKRRLGLAGLSHSQRKEFLAPHTTGPTFLTSPVASRTSGMAASHRQSLPSELRRRIASFHPDEASSEPHSGTFSVQMCSLFKENVSDAVFRWLSGVVAHENLANQCTGGKKLWSSNNGCLTSSLARVVDFICRSSDLGKHSLLLPLYHA